MRLARAFTAVLALLRQRELAGCIVTAGALRRQKEATREISDKVSVERR